MWVFKKFINAHPFQARKYHECTDSKKNSKNNSQTKKSFHGEKLKEKDNNANLLQRR